MSELPRRLSQKTALSSNWLNRLLDFLRSRDLRAGPGIKLTRTPSGTTVSAMRSDGGGSSRKTGVVPVKTLPTTADYWSDGVPIELYEDGFLLPSTGYGTVYLPEVGGRAAPSPGIACLAHWFVAMEVQSGPADEIEPEAEEQ